MVAKGEYDLMANRSHRRLPTLLSVRAHQHEAGGMIRDPGARISIRATGATHAPDSTGRIYDRNPFPSAVSHSCARAGSIYDRQGRAAGKIEFAAAATGSSSVILHDERRGRSGLPSGANRRGSSGLPSGANVVCQQRQSWPARRSCRAGLNHSGSLTVVRAFDLRPLIARLAVVGIGGLCVLRRGVVLSDLRRAGAG